LIKIPGAVVSFSDEMNM